MNGSYATDNPCHHAACPKLNCLSHRDGPGNGDAFVLVVALCSLDLSWSEDETGRVYCQLSCENAISKVIHDDGLFSMVSSKSISGILCTISLSDIFSSLLQRETC